MYVTRKPIVQIPIFMYRKSHHNIMTVKKYEIIILHFFSTMNILYLYDKTIVT